MTSPLVRPREAASTLAATHEECLCLTLALALLRRDAVPGAVGLQLPGLRVVGEQGLEDPFELVADLEVFDRDNDLDPVVEVPRHQVGAPEEVRLLVARLEAEEAAVLEEAAEHRAHPDVLAQAVDARHEGADRPD